MPEIAAITQNEEQLKVCETKKHSPIPEEKSHQKAFQKDGFEKNEDLGVLESLDSMDTSESFEIGEVVAREEPIDIPTESEDSFDSTDARARFNVKKCFVKMEKVVENEFAPRGAEEAEQAIQGMLEQLAVSSEESGGEEERRLPRQPSVSIHRLCRNCPEVVSLFYIYSDFLTKNAFFGLNYVNNCI